MTNAPSNAASSTSIPSAAETKQIVLKEIGCQMEQILRA